MGAKYVLRYLGGSMVQSRAVTDTTNLGPQTLATIKDKEVTTKLLSGQPLALTQIASLAFKTDRILRDFYPSTKST